MQNFEISTRQPCRSQNNLKNAYLLAKVGTDTAENERTFSEISTKFRDVTAFTRAESRGRRRPGSPRTPRASGGGNGSQKPRLVSREITAAPRFGVQSIIWRVRTGRSRRAVIKISKLLGCIPLTG